MNEIKQQFIKEFKAKAYGFVGVVNDIQHHFIVASSLNTLLRKYKARGHIYDDVSVVCSEGATPNEMKITILKGYTEVLDIDDIFTCIKH